jgi:hypothetical protein
MRRVDLRDDAVLRAWMLLPPASQNPVQDLAAQIEHATHQRAMLQAEATEVNTLVQIERKTTHILQFITDVRPPPSLGGWGGSVGEVAAGRQPGGKCARGVFVVDTDRSASHPRHIDALRIPAIFFLFFLACSSHGCRTTYFCCAAVRQDKRAGRQCRAGAAFFCRVRQAGGQDNPHQRGCALVVLAVYTA